MLQLPGTDPINDPARLWQLQCELLGMAEKLFGPRDTSFKICQPEFRPDGPRIRFTPDNTGVYAELSPNGRLYWPTVLYELAHETVHLLNPGLLGTENNLEEGVAVAYSIYALRQYHVPDSEIDKYPKMEQYKCALKLANCLPEGALKSAGRIRREVGRLSDATSDDLRGLYCGLEPSIAEKLASKFT